MTCNACNDVRLVDDGNGLSVPCDACEAATIAAMHAQTAPGMDCDDDPTTWAGPSYPAAPVMAAEVDALRARIAELEAQLDAVPVTAIHAVTYSADTPLLMDKLTVTRWLAARAEVLP